MRTALLAHFAASLAVCACGDDAATVVAPADLATTTADADVAQVSGDASSAADVDVANAPDVAATGDVPTCPAVCPDPGPCATAACNPATAKCEISPKADGASCDDGNVCTGPDQCQAGACKPGKLSAPCACLSDADCLPQDDGKVCNGTLYCDKSAPIYLCKPNPGSVFQCPAAVLPCSQSVCLEPGDKNGLPDKASCAVVPAEEGAVCDDGKPFTIGDTCEGGVCVAGTKTAVCATDTDCASYEDGNQCNGTLFCNKAAKQCQVNPKTVVVCPTADDTACLQAQCQYKEGSCKLVAINNGKACDDGNKCTSGEACKQGQCAASQSADTCGCKTDADCGKFEDGDQCNGTLFCNLQTAQCQLNPASVVFCPVGLNTACSLQQCDKGSGKCQAVSLPDDTTCDADGSLCTPKDLCKSGLCKADTNLCECVNDIDCAAKEDGNWCNGTLYCNKATKKCEVNPKTAVSCPTGGDGACSKTECLPATGQCLTLAINKLGPCDDGDATTKDDTCDLNGSCLGTSITGKCASGKGLDCNDGNPCTDDFCHPQAGCNNKANLAMCSDGDACTVNDGCFNGQCKSGPLVNCDDSNPCTTEKCDVKLGCLVQNHLGPCSDGTACTNGDLCQAGKCAPGPVLDCDDQSGCTADSCNPALGCVYLPLAATCDDGDACSDGDVCFKGTCKSGFAVDCDDGNSCTHDKCDGKLGCLHTPNTAPCNDGSVCTVGDLCATGKCVPGSKVDCDDDEICTSDGCHQTLGCTHTAAAGPCDDGDNCTDGDKCFKGVCKPGAEANCDDNNPCTGDKCDLKLGCVHANLSVPCSDGSVCTAGDTCGGGNCVPGPPIPCDDASLCTTDSCHPALGCVHLAVAATCEDGDACTDGDTCFKGACKPGQELDCNDANPCTKDSCSSKLGCVNANTLSPCDDGNVCSKGDACQAGKCVPGPKLDCDDLNPCSDDSCNPTLGCLNTVTTKACDDGNACTANDLCGGGTCKGGLAPNCNDGNPCTDDGCNPTKGCTAAANAAPCDDKNPCTVGDACADSGCKGGKALDCDDNNACTADGCDLKTGQCSHSNADGACDDGNACTAPGTCKGGACQNGAAKVCKDDNPCTDDSCDGAKGGCVFAPNSALCTDNDACTLGEKCVAGTCSAGGKNGCEDGDPCTSDACDGKTGLCSHQLQAVCLLPPCASNADCTSGLCDQTVHACRQCLSNADCTDAGQVCMAGRCSEGNKCTSTVACKSLGKVCNLAGKYCVTCATHNDCGANSLCVGFACIPKVACSVDSQCPMVCASDWKACVECNGNGDCLGGGECGADHVCKAPVCKASGCASGSFFACAQDGIGYAAGKACDDKKLCTDDTCDAKKGCVSLANSVTCNDGDPCTSSDQCQAGACLGKALNCDDQNACTLDTCNAVDVSCSHTPTVANCDDGKPCTSGDVCKNGVCTFTGLTNCDDGNVCTTDGCDPTAGCKFVNNAGPCEAKACTWGDKCTDGACKAGTVGRYFEARLSGKAPDGKPSVAYGSCGDAYQNGDIAVSGYQGGYNPWNFLTARLGPDGKVMWQVNGTNNSNHNYFYGCQVTQSQVLANIGYYSPAWWTYRQSATGAGLTSESWHPGDYGVALSIREDATGFVAGGYFYAGGRTWACGLKQTTTGGALQSMYVDTGINEIAYDAIAHPFGGYWLVGATQTKGSIYYDGLLLRFSATAAFVGKTIVGGGAEDRFHSLALLPKGGLAIAGFTGSKGAGNADGWLVFTGEDGKVTREVTFGGAGNDTIRSMVPTSDGGYTLAGWTASGGAQGNDGWVVHTDALGNLMWQRTYGGAKDDQLQSVRTTPEGGLALVGTSDSQFTALQAWVLRTDPWGNSSCSEAGACAGLKLQDCSDGNPCTADWCHQVAGCMHKALADGALCSTAGNTCKSGVCLGL